MGGCCCSAKGPELTIPSGYNYFSRISEEQVTPPAHHGATTILFPGNLVDTNLDTSIPDTYRPPPAPIPYNVVLGRPLIPATHGKSDETGKIANSVSAGDSVAGDNTQDISVKCLDLKLSDCKEQYDFDIQKGKELERCSPKSAEPAVPPEECPTCLEEYDADNPKVITKCEHHFHLACILEWLERSDACPVCGQEMAIGPPTS
ncbi:hypothetical protein SAY87_024806 [Trapa incisa]|uniref:RING-type E3 ubiquitin transferase n=1 Tax=Trapa incisa TaxID=236973 RepID=A0AAN7JG79_9MYRT|nr:hypothetical protein SAY87_024806 [Trapa incisa]